MTDGQRSTIQYKPRNAPRRRIVFEPDHDADGLEYCYWQIERVWDVDAEKWREIGREHVSEPTIRTEGHGVVAPESTADTVGCDDV